MTRGATQTFIVRLPLIDTEDSVALEGGYPLVLLKAWCICFGRGRRVFLDKSGGFDAVHIDIDEEQKVASFKVTLTEKESLQLRAGEVTVQAKISLSNGEVMVSTQGTINVAESLCGKEMKEHGRV